MHPLVSREKKKNWKVKNFTVYNFFFNLKKVRKMDRICPLQTLLLVKLLFNVDLFHWTLTMKVNYWRIQLTLNQKQGFQNMKVLIAQLQQSITSYRFLCRTTYFMFTWKTWFRMLLHCYLVNRGPASVSSVWIRSKTCCSDCGWINCAVSSSGDRDIAVQLKALVPIICARQRWKKTCSFPEICDFPS